jgi:hypothetical protein
MHHQLTSQKLAATMLLGAPLAAIDAKEIHQARERYLAGKRTRG